jgi:protocatechuate 3,4-dioxygenase, alpha subunit
LKTSARKAPGKRPDLTPIPSQTVGPYFQIGLTGPRVLSQIAGPSVKGERVKLTCTVFDGEGKPVPDAMIEIWQANADGKYNHPGDRQKKPIDPHFLGFGRVGTNDDGMCVFETIRPGRVPGRGEVLQAPHLEISVLARGLLKRLATRIYFAGDPANEEDPVLALVPSSRRATLMAHPITGEPGGWRQDIHLSGKKETVFFDV